MSRIDDAVSRILRVKMRAGLWEKPAPSLRALAGEQQLLGAKAHRLLAHEAVCKSMVLLKNKNEILPLLAWQRCKQSAEAMWWMEHDLAGNRDTS